MQVKNLRGSIVALITPFKNDQLDERALRKLVNFHIANGTNALLTTGTTGETTTLTNHEHKRVIDVVIEENNGRLPVIVGAGSNNPMEAIEYSLHAQKAGADALLHVAGYYNRPNQDGLYAHFKKVHDACDLPIIIYNIPPRAVVDVKPTTMKKLEELPRIIGVKDATGDLARPLLERQLIKKNFVWLSGEDATAVAYNANGGTGCISVTANIAPRLCSEIQTACQLGNFNKALQIQERLMPLHTALFEEPNPMGAKYAASLLGLCEPTCRVPLICLTKKTQQKIEKAMKNLELY